MWLKNLWNQFTAWLNETTEAVERVMPDDSYEYMLTQGFQKVYLTGTDGKPYVADDMVGWFVDEEGRCWRFRAPIDDPDSWPFIDGSMFATIDRPDELVIQYVIDGEDACWWAEETLVLERCSTEELLERLTPYPTDWTLAARRLGLGTIGAWATG